MTDYLASLRDLKPQDIISLLRLAMDGWKLFGEGRFKDKKTPDKVKEILVLAERQPPNREELNRRLTEALDPGDAAIVQGDLDFMSLFALPTPSLDAFDYWGQLTKLVGGLHAYAGEKRLFELRGDDKAEVGEVLFLPRSGKCILPDKLAVELAEPSHHMEGVKDAECLALLRKNTQDTRNDYFPIIAVVAARFNEYHSTGGPPSVKSYASYFFLGPGQQRHWLRFVRRDSSYHFIQRYEYRLQASDLINIAQAITDDIHEYAGEVHADEQKIQLLFQRIDAFAKGN